MKNKKNLFWIIPLILLIIAVSSYIIGTQETAFGFSVLSVDAPKVMGNEDLSELNWLITTTLGGGDKVVGIFSESLLKSKSGVSPEKSFSLTAQGVEEYVKYSINKQEPLYDYDVIKSSSYCPSTHRNWVYPYKSSFGNTDYICVKRSLIGWYGNLENPVTKFKAGITLQIQGNNPITKTISSEDSSISFTDSSGILATVTWEGSLVTGNPLPTVYDKRAIIDYEKSTQWRMVNIDGFNKYEQKQNGIETRLDSVTSEELSEFNYGDKLKSEIQGLIEDIETSRRIDLKENLESGFMGENLESENFASFKYLSKSKITNPVLKIWLRADTIGIERTAGMPEILKLESNEFGSGETGKIIATIKNSGTGDGYFNMMVECENHIEQKYNTEQFSLEMGDTKEQSLEIVADKTNTKLIELCKVTVYDRNLPTNKDTATIQVTMNPATVCSANSYFLQEDCIYKCNSEGTESNLIKCCGNEGTSYNDGVYVCGEINDDSNMVQWFKDLFGKDSSILKNILGTVLIVVAIVIIIYVLSFLIKILNLFKG